MKKSILSTLVGLSISLSTLANIGPIANTQIIQFDVSNDAHNYFYCDVNSTKVTPVIMRNHNCLISGFNKSGRLEISNKFALSKVSHTYFDVIADPGKRFVLSKNVMIQFGGNEPNGIVCHRGKGNRFFSIRCAQGAWLRFECLSLLILFPLSFSPENNHQFLGEL